MWYWVWSRFKTGVKYPFPAMQERAEAESRRIYWMVGGVGMLGLSSQFVMDGGSSAMLRIGGALGAGVVGAGALAWSHLSDPDERAKLEGERSLASDRRSGEPRTRRARRAARKMVKQQARAAAHDVPQSSGTDNAKERPPTPSAQPKARSKPAPQRPDSPTVHWQGSEYRSGGPFGR